MEGLKKSKRQLRVDKALMRLASAALSTENIWTSELSPELELMKEKYNLDDEDALAVAVLFVKQQAPRQLLLKVMEDLSPLDRTAPPRLNALAQQGIIISAPNGVCRLAPHVREAFSNGEPFGILPIADSMQSLRGIHTMIRASLFNGDWLDAFTAGFSLPGNERFRMACEQLNLASYPKLTQVAFWILANNFIRHFSAPYTHENDDETDVRNDSFTPLVKGGLADIVTSLDGNTGTWFVLSAKAAGVLFYGVEGIIQYDQLAKYATIEQNSDIKTVELFFPPEAASEIEALRKVISPDGFERALAVLRRKKKNPAIQSLIWGPSGTGKTEVVRQLARESGRDLVRLESARVTNSGWGDSEKAYQDFFRAYRYVAVISPNVPILLLNEADALLSRRIGTIERAIDKAENAITDILLQEIESMHGILLVTTNFTDNIDDAFERRFLFKTELGQPDEATRECIWKSHIPELSREEAHILARDYDLSGGQIHNVAARRDMAELYYAGDRGLLFIRELCEKELTVQRKKGAGRKIGFCL